MHRSFHQASATIPALITISAFLFLLSSVAHCAEVTAPAEVIDGDTLSLLRISVRLDGIDAPEARQECERADGASYACGEDATGFLSKLIGTSEVLCTITGEDRYGRYLGRCRTAMGVEINARMVRAGWAVAFERYSDHFMDEQAQAKAEGVGMWAGTFDMPWDWRAEQVADAGPEGDCLIKGNISRSGERIYHMPFQQDYDGTKIDESAGEHWFCSEDEALAAGWRRAVR